MIRIALDSNVLLYYAGVDRGGDDPRKVAAASGLMRDLTGRAMLIAPVQALGELYAVLTRTGASRDEARMIVLRAAHVLGTASSAESTLFAALDLATTHRLQLWDSMILSAAADAGCTLLLSEDMQAGFTWQGVTITNPFAASPDPRLAALFA